MGIILSADSPCDLTAEMQVQNAVHTIPYHIVVNGKEYRDGVDITQDQLFEIYQETGQLPHTAAVNAGEYSCYFKPWVEAGHEVIHFCLGSALTSSYQNCLSAAEELGHITVIDSGNLSGGIGLQLLDCRAMIDAGKSREEIAAFFSHSQQSYHSSFILDTLDFLHAGGRCSALAALSASLLSIRPEIVVHNRDASMSVSHKYRGSFEKVVPKYVKRKLAGFPDIETDKIILAYTGPSTTAVEKMAEMVRADGRFRQIYVVRASCTISCHCGPNTVGIFLKTENVHAD